MKLVKFINLIKETLANARALQREKELSTVASLQAQLDKERAEKEELFRQLESSRKMGHYQNRAISKLIKDNSLNWNIIQEIVRCIDKYRNLSYKELIDKHYECE